MRTKMLKKLMAFSLVGFLVFLAPVAMAHGSCKEFFSSSSVIQKNIPLELAKAINAGLLKNETLLNQDIYSAIDEKGKKVYIFQHRDSLFITAFDPNPGKLLGLFKNPHFLNGIIGSFKLSDGRTTQIRGQRVDSINGKTTSRIRAIEAYESLWTGSLAGYSHNELFLQYQDPHTVKIQGSIGGYMHNNLQIQRDQSGDVRLTGKLAGYQHNDLKLTRVQPDVAIITGQVMGYGHNEIKIERLSTNEFRLTGTIAGYRGTDLLIKRDSLGNTLITGFVMGYSHFNIKISNQRKFIVDEDIEQMSYVLTPMAFFHIFITTEP